MEKKIITSEKLPVKGPYATAVEAGGFLFISGQLPIDPATDEVIMEIRAATRQVLKNLQMLLGECGLSLQHVVKTTLFINNMRDFASVNEIYAGFFPLDPPARSTVEVAALPKGAPIEIEAVAIRN